MANDFIYGVDGAIWIGGEQLSYMNGWTMNINTGVVDTPDIGSSGPKRVYSKYKDFSGSVNGFMRYDPALQSTLASNAQERSEAMFVSAGVPAQGVARFVESTASMFSGNVVLSNITKTNSAEGLQGWSADWSQSTGPLVHNTDTTT